jgi:hypothetical protein
MQTIAGDDDDVHDFHLSSTSAASANGSNRSGDRPIRRTTSPRARRPSPIQIRASCGRVRRVGRRSGGSTNAETYFRQELPSMPPKGLRDFSRVGISRHALERFSERFGANEAQAEPELRAVLKCCRRLGTNPRSGAIAVLGLFRDRPLVAIVQAATCTTVLTWAQFETKLADFGRPNVARKWGRYLARIAQGPNEPPASRRLDTAFDIASDPGSTPDSGVMLRNDPQRPPKSDFLRRSESGSRAGIPT